MPGMKSKSIGINGFGRIDFEFDKYYESVVGVSQKIRHELLNKKSNGFWARKLRRDVAYGILGLLYLEGKTKVNFTNLSQIEKKYPSLVGCSSLINKKQKLSALWYYSENLRVILEQIRGVKYGKN